MDERRSARAQTTSRTNRAQRQARREQTRARRREMQSRTDAVTDVVRSHPKTFVFLGLVLVIVLMLYGPTRNYYVAVRTNQELQARYDAIAAQNELLEGDLNRLQSEEGIEDEAHRRGWVKDGETGVVVEGLPEDDLKALLGEVEIEDTRPWYIKMLDVLFFFSEDSWQ